MFILSKLRAAHISLQPNKNYSVLTSGENWLEMGVQELLNGRLNLTMGHFTDESCTWIQCQEYACVISQQLLRI